MRAFFALIISIAVTSSALGMGTTAQAEKETGECERDYKKAIEKCNEAAEAADQALQESQGRELEEAGINGTQLELAARYRAAAKKLAEIKKQCKKNADAATKICGQAQRTVDAAKGELAEISMNLGRDAVNPEESRRVTVAGERVHTTWWKNDSVHAKEVPKIQTQIDRLNSQAAELEAQARTTAGSTPSNGSNPATATAADQGSRAAANGLNAGANAGQPANGGAAAAPSGLGATPAPGYTLGSATLPPGASAGLLPTDPGGFAEPGGGTGSIEDIVTSPVSEERRLVDDETGIPLPPLPGPENASASAAVAPSGGGMDPPKAGGASSAEPAGDSAAAKAAAAKILAGSSGFGGGGGSSSWWRSATGALGFGSDARVAGARGPAGAGGVDLSRFLPGQGPLSAREMRRLGIHGPHVNMFDKLSERYHSLKGSLEP